MGDKFYVSLPYIYPVCPLNIDHARMFIISDIIARYSRYMGRDVFFPVASHYTGNTAQKVAGTFHKIYIENDKSEEETKKVLNLYENIYGTPDYVLKNFQNPEFILDYYSQEILWELRSLDISCDYDLYYTTKDKDFTIFVNTIISLYQKHKVLTKNKEQKLALDYDNHSWKEKIVDLLKKTEFVQKFHKSNVMSAMENVRNDWGFIREGGFGAQYKEWIIDPMFDSELFTIYNVFIKLKDKYPDQLKDAEAFFYDLFESLGSGNPNKSHIIEEFAGWLPCDVFVCEEHLKNWIVKRLYSESLLLESRYTTKKYFITGMGLLSGRRMSASRGHAILTKDLINSYGPLRTRLIILLTGGHPSKIYRYDTNLPEQADKLLKKIINYTTYLTTLVNDGAISGSGEDNDCDFDLMDKKIENLLKDGYYRQIILELITVVPKKFRNPDSKTANKLLSIYKKYFDIILPGLILS